MRDLEEQGVIHTNVKGQQSVTDQQACDNMALFSLCVANCM